jgi:RNA polymerase sigma-70 factor (ECF subfamily)
MKDGSGSLDDLAPQVYEELRRLARHYLSRERPSHTLQPTALVHEAYVRLAGQRVPEWQSRAHFVGLAATMMRRILLNHARARRAAKRDGQCAGLQFEATVNVAQGRQIEVLDLERAMERLRELDAQQEKVVELRIYGGLSVDETADVLGISRATVKRDWATARLWLTKQLHAH